MDRTRRTIVKSLPALAGAAAVALPAARVGGMVLTSRSVTFTAAAGLDPAERARHEGFMALAIDLIEKGGAPFGTVIVDRPSGAVVCTGVNPGAHSRIRHGEIVAIDNCAKVEPEVRWRDLILYTTAESCPMCASAEIWAGIPEVVYGTSIDDLAAMGVSQIRLDSPTIAAAATFYEGRIIGGVLKDRTDAMLRAWAERRR